MRHAGREWPILDYVLAFAPTPEPEPPPEKKQKKSVARFKLPPGPVLSAKSWPTSIEVRSLVDGYWPDANCLALPIPYVGPDFGLPTCAGEICPICGLAKAGFNQEHLRRCCLSFNASEDVVRYHDGREVA